jgi:hypothetical protein
VLHRPIEPAQRQTVFDAIRDDMNVPKNALILIDVHRLDDMNEYLLTDRLRVLFEHLGPKCGLVLAVIVPSGLGADQARAWKSKPIDLGMRVSLFTDEQLARDWLNTYRRS